MINVGIVGGTGYTGVELLRLLSQHPAVNIKAITSRKEAGTLVGDLFPNLRGVLDLAFVAPDKQLLMQCDVVFFATPHAVSMYEIPDLLENGVKVIDLSADFRLKDEAVFSQWYGCEHAAKAYLSQAVYGLPEFNRQAIVQANLIAAPGCYPTAVQLGFIPLIQAGVIDNNYLIADVKSGVSGAGREAKVASLFAELSDNFKAYAANGHRHQPEIEQELSRYSQMPVHCTFVPHLLPTLRGIEATLYAPIINHKIDIHELFSSFYADEYFIDVMDDGSYPETRSVRGTNKVRIGLYHSVDRQNIIVSVVEDNLVKGASGQAVQCMNIMFALEERLGLENIALLP